ncbi:MAG: 50S ribosomal protein L22 [Deltaproteobacteria bacterium]
MESRAIARHVSVSARKARLVVDLVRGRNVGEAMSILYLTEKKVADVVAKTLKSAIANAEDTQNVDVDRLYVKTAYVDEGPTQYRWRPRAQGRATPIRKRTSHITLILDERGSKEI